MSARAGSSGDAVLSTLAGRIDPDWTVNDTLRIFPATVAVFDRFGIDACCGGAASIAAAARRDGADLVALIEALRLAAEQGR